jgi:F-type H+-transporting ATP synthase subunit e
MCWQVVRYSALLTGVLYGIVHRRTLQAQENVKKEKHSEERHEELLKRAQQAWRDRHANKKDDGQ